MGIVWTTSGWLGASIAYVHASGSATFEVRDDVANAYEVAQLLRDWLDNSFRPWASDISGVTVVAEEDAARRRIRFVYSFTGSAPTFSSVTPDAQWIALFGDTSASPPTAAAASCSSVPGTVTWARWEASSGERSREGSWRMTAGDVASRRPRVSLEMTLGQSYAFGAAVRAASQPRTAYILDEMTDTWRFVTLGRHELSHPDGDPTIVVGTLDVLGGL